MSLRRSSLTLRVLMHTETHAGRNLSTNPNCPAVVRNWRRERPWVSDLDCLFLCRDRGSGLCHFTCRVTGMAVASPGGP